MTLTELAKKLREAACDNGGMTAGLSPHQEHLTEAVDRLEAIERAWRRYDDDPIQSFDTEQEAYDALRRAIEGTEP